MAWFTEDAPAFFAELRENNNREWYEANKKRYDRDVKKPAELFAGEMIGRMQEKINPAIDTTPKSAVFRLHRDTRFSKDKTPYKEHLALVVAPGGRHEPGVTGLYFHFNHEQLVLASGLYFVEPAQLALIRRHIADHGDELHRLLEDQAFVEHFKELQGDKNKILPPEFKEAGSKEPHIFNKQFFYWREMPINQLYREDLPEFVMSHMLACQPLNEFLTAPLRR